MPINVPLLTKTLNHIEAHPEEWDQRTWRCSTAMCFAGHAVNIMGAQWHPEFLDYVLPEADDPPTDIDYEGDVRVEVRARRLLGLTGDQARSLFWGDNTLDDLRRIVAQLCEGKTP